MQDFEADWLLIGRGIVDDLQGFPLRQIEAIHW